MSVFSIVSITTVGNSHRTISTVFQNVSENRASWPRHLCIHWSLGGKRKDEGKQKARNKKAVGNHCCPFILERVRLDTKITLKDVPSKC